MPQWAIADCQLRLPAEEGCLLHFCHTNDNSPSPLPLCHTLQYVYLVADWHLNKRLGTAASAFGRGLSRVRAV